MFVPYSFSRPFFDKRMSAEVEGDSLGPEWKGYVFKITGVCAHFFLI